jgi:hypothetical protein
MYFPAKVEVEFRPVVTLTYLTITINLNLALTSSDVHHMGNKVRNAPMAGVVTSVRIDMGLYLKARKRGLNMSQVLNTALRGLLVDSEADMTDEQVAALLKEREAKIETHLARAESKLSAAFEEAIIELQSRWNMYLAAAPGTTRAAKLEWITGKKDAMPALRVATSEAILAELEGP